MRPGIRVAVAARFPIDEREEQSQRLFLEHFDALTDPFDRNADPVHVTASAIVVSDGPGPTIGHGSTALILHKKMGMWLQPGGHIEQGELTWEAAQREAVEETGLDLRHPTAGPQLCHVDVHPGPDGHTHLDLRYLLVGPLDEPKPAAGESQEVRWYPWAEALAAAEPGLLGALQALAGDPVPS